MPTTEYLPYSGTHACADIDSTIDEVRTARGNEASLNARINADVSALNTEIATKANSSDVTASLALKADSSTVTAALAEKADADDTTAALATKASASVVADISAVVDVVAPEVAAARVGADGTSYQALKARLDSENAELKSDITRNTKGLLVNFYANESMYFESDGNDLYWKAKETYIRGVSFKTIAASAYETQTSTAGETGCVKIGNNQALIAYTSGLVSVVDLANIREDSIPIFVCTQGKVVGGLGLWAYIQWKEKEEEKRIDTNFSKVLTSQNYDFGFVIGSLNPGTGTEFTSTTRIRSDYLRVAKGTEIFLGDSAATNTLVVYEFTADKAYISDSSWSDGNTYTVQNNGYVRILIRKNSTNAEISTSEVETLAANVTVILPKFEMLEQEIEDVDAKIGNVEPLPKIPEYFETAISDAEAAIKSNLETTGVKGKTFIFCTDIHWANDTHSAPNLIARIRYDNPRVDTLYLGGDYVTNGTHTAMLSDMYDCIDSFGKSECKMFSVLGNHDTNVYSTGNHITLAEFYAAVQSRNDDSTVYGEYTYFYADDTKTKTRTIFIDSGMEGSTLSAEQSAWIDDVLESTPAGWHIICVWHIVYGLASGTTWQDVPLSLVPTAFSSAVFSKLDAYNELSTGAKVEAIFGGHVHCDLDFNTDGGIPIVLVDTASKQPLNGGSATVGTTTETAFDIITVDYNAKIIKCVRVGRGSNRTINY